MHLQEQLQLDFWKLHLRKKEKKKKSNMICQKKTNKQKTKTKPITGTIKTFWRQFFTLVQTYVFLILALNLFTYTCI
jgi:hypothetical protein